MTIKKILALRRQIDKVDAQIIKKLADRQKLSVKIGLVKAGMEHPVIDLQREKQQAEHYGKLSQEYQLDASFIKKLFHTIILHSRALQKNVKDSS